MYNDTNSKAYTQLNRLVIAKLTSNPSYGCVYSLKGKGLTPAQYNNCVKLVNRIRDTKRGVVI